MDRVLKCVYSLVLVFTPVNQRFDDPGGHEFQGVGLGPLNCWEFDLETC